MISVRATEQLVDALNQAVDLEGGAAARIEFLLRRLQALLERQSRCALWFLENLNRRPAPLISSRTVVRAASDDGPVGSDSEAQKVLEESMPLSQSMIERVQKHIRTPVTMIASEAGDSGWFQKVLVPRHLAPMGYADSIVSLWAATADRAVFLVCHRREADRVFTPQDATLMSVMMRGAAPIVDRAMFQQSAQDPKDLSPREREILLMLLAGDSEKEVASKLSRSVHTVHTFVQRLYRLFEVSSRGELMALFIDKAVLATLRDA